VIFLDTNVIAETMRRAPSELVTLWLSLHDADIALSTVAIAEIAYGIERIREDQRAPELSQKLDLWRQRMAGRIHGFDEESALLYGRLMGAAKLGGRTMSEPDGMMAAISLRHGASLATRNTRHFAVAGLALINPWDDRRQSPPPIT
jgi:predicted nucleic acid-binding protein